MASSIRAHYILLKEEQIQLHYLECEGKQSSEEAILLLHGWPTSSFLYRKMMQPLAKHHRVIALDLPGFGKSDKNPGDSFSFRYHGRILDEFVAQLGIKKVHLVVHDLGGPIGLWWAQQHREQVASYVILNTVVIPPFSWGVKLFVLMTLVPLVRKWLSSPAGIRFSMRLGIHDHSILTPEVLEGYQSPFVRTSDDSAARKSLLKSAHSLHMNGFKDVAEGLANISAPTCLICAEKDRILPRVKETTQHIHALIPHASNYSIPDCGHFLQEEKPTVVATIMSDFYQQLSHPS
ncbi:MAG: alpha/beta hydrolase [Bacteroidota bacterium]